MQNTPQQQFNVQEEPYLQQIYIETNHWLSNMSFYDDEIRFLKYVLDKYFATSLHDDHVNRVQLLSSQLSNTRIVKNLIKEEVLKHRNNLDATIKNNIPKREDFLALEHTRLREELKDMKTIFKNIKSDIFAISEVALKSEKLNS